jgi:two-component system CheB/CheR fusion protein
MTLPVRPKPPVIDQEEEFFAEMLLEKYAPDCLLLTEENKVIYVTGKAENYLNFPKRKDNLLLFDMIGESTSLAFHNGLRKIKEEERNVVLRGVEAMTNDGIPVIVDIFFYSIYSNRTSTKYILVEIKSVDDKQSDQEFIEVSARESIKEIERLEAELRQVKQELHYHMDELETINEELQSSNEEMKSSNEEMQTTNEEMQSANEELKTVNFELKSKIEEITVLHDDVENLFISTQIATLFLDRNLKIRKFTPALQQYFNIRDSDIGRPIYHYTHNFGYSELEIDVEKVLQTLQPLEREIETNQGFALIRIIPYKTDDRRIEGIVLTFVDVSPLKKANLKLKQMASTLKTRTGELEQLENYWKSLVENTPDIVARLDQNATILFVNNSLKSHLGIEAQSLIGKNLSELSHKNFQKEIQVLCQQVQLASSSNKSVNYNQNFSLNNNTKIYFITLIPEKSAAKGQHETLLIIARDITELRTVEFKFKEKNRILEDMNQQMDSFVHAVAHDLRAPLTNLKLILELIGDEENPEKREMLLGKLNLAVVRIDEILNGLIEIIDTQVNSREKKRRIKFKTVIHKILDQFKDMLPVDSLIDIHLEVKEVYHIKGFLFSIIRNLIHNAIKYRRQDMPLKIRMETWKEGEFVVFSIEDNGIGMDADNVNHHLFKPFRQFDLIGKGIGIGLHIVKSMVERTGGKIEVDSEKGKGTKFSIYFKEEESEFIDD